MMVATQWLAGLLLVLSSAIIPAAMVSAAGVELFGEPDFGGRPLSVGPGVRAGERLRPVGDDAVASLRVPENAIVRLSEDADGGGWNWLYRPGEYAEVKPFLRSKVSRVHAMAYRVDQLQGLIDEAITKGHRLIRLRPNTWYQQSGTLTIRGASDLTIDGNGCMIVMADPNADGMRIENSTGVTLRNFSMDYDPLPFTQGRFVSVNAEEQYGDLKIFEGYTDDPYLYNAEPEINGMNLWDPQTRLMRTDVVKHFVQKCTRIDEGLVRVPSWTLRVGDLASLHNPWRGVAIRCDRSKDCVFDRINLFAAPGGGFYGTGGEGGHRFVGCNVQRGPTWYGNEPRLLATNRDSYHFNAMRRGPLIENCTASFVSDDAVNIHAFFGKLGTVNDSWVQLEPAYPHRVGDMIDIHDAETLQRVVRAEVVALGDNPQWVQLDNVTGIAPKIEPGMVVVFPEHACRGTVVKDCRFTDLEARGILLRCSDSKAIGNVIERTGISGIWVGPEVGFYREPGFPENVEIIGNRLSDIGRSPRSTLHTERLVGAINVLAGVDTPDQAVKMSGNRLMRNITIADNTVDGVAGAGIMVASATDVTVENNRISRSHQQGPARLGELFRKQYPGFVPTGQIVVMDADHVSGRGNRYSGAGDWAGEAVQSTGDTESVSVEILGG